MKVVYGDLIELALDGKLDIIIHGCNCFNTMGSGLALSIKKAFPEAYKVDQLTISGDKNKLGTISHAICMSRIQTPIVVVNAYTQYHYGRLVKHTDLLAVRSVMKSIKEEFHGYRIGYPRIGAGLGGGNWDDIYKIIEEELVDEDHTLVEYLK